MKYLAEKMATFLRACPQEYHYVAHSEVAIPFPPEMEFLDVVDGFQRLRGDGLAQLRESLQYKDFYTLSTFSVRMSILAVRLRDTATLKRAVISFLIDHHLVDYRDVLARIAIINDCAARLGEDLECLVHPHKALSYKCRWNMMETFFKREPEHKEVRVFGHSAREGPDGLEYECPALQGLRG